MLYLQELLLKKLEAMGDYELERHTQLCFGSCPQHVLDGFIAYVMKIRDTKGNITYKLMDEMTREDRISFCLETNQYIDRSK